jgi:hypothetical protein
MSLTQSYACLDFNTEFVQGMMKKGLQEDYRLRSYFQMKYQTLRKGTTGALTCRKVRLRLVALV